MGSYEVTFLLNGEEALRRYVSIPLSPYQPRIPIGDSGVTIEHFSQRVRQPGDKVDRGVARIASTALQTWIGENVTPVTVAYWALTMAACVAPEPVATKATCVAMLGGGATMLKVGTAKAAFKTAVRLSDADEGPRRTSS